MGCVTGEMQLGLAAGASWCSQAWCIAAAAPPPTGIFTRSGRCRVHYLSTAAAPHRAGAEKVRRRAVVTRGSRAEGAHKILANLRGRDIWVQVAMQENQRRESNVPGQLFPSGHCELE